MPASNWPTTALGKEVKFLSGGTPSKSETAYWGGHIPWIGSGEMKAERIASTALQVTERGALNGTKLVEPGTVLVVVRGMSLANEFRVARPVVPATFNQDVKALISKGKIRNDFLYYYLKAQSNAIRDSASEAAHGTKKLDMPVLEQWPLPVVDEPEQRKIAAILTAYDDLIENNRQRIALLEKMAEEIYREWFVRLRFPGHEHTPVRKGVPEGWKPTTLFDLCRLKRGYDLPKQNVVPGEYPILAATGIAGFHSSYKAEPPVVTTGRSGSLGAVVWSSKPSWPLNTALYVADNRGNSKHFLFFTLKSANLAQFNSGAGVPTLNRNHLSCVKVSRPPGEIQGKFDSIVSPMRDQVDTLRQSTNVLTETRALLLNRLISGKLRVDDLDIQLPPSMQDEAA